MTPTTLDQPSVCLLPDTATRLIRSLVADADRLRGVIAGNWDTLSSEDRAIVGEVAADLNAWSGDLAFIRAIEAGCEADEPALTELQTRSKAIADDLKAKDDDNPNTMPVAWIAGTH